MSDTPHIPAIDLPLVGHALIEASAGTGKTWTLTGIFLRLLIEEGYEPRHIVATTFTRAAAAEMRERVQARVEAFRALLVRIIEAYGQHPALLEDDAALPERVENWLNAQENPERDTVNLHILRNILHAGLDAFIGAYRHILDILQTLDHMFIGTLDGLCQRWLRELSMESGVDTIRINTAPEAVAQLSHDHLRRYYHEQAQQHPARFAEFYSREPPSGTQYLKNSRDALNHGNTPFLALPALQNTPDYWQACEDARQTLQTFSNHDIAAAQNILADMAAHDILDGRSALKKHHLLLAELIPLLARDDSPDKNGESLLASLAAALSPDNDGSTTPYKQSARKPHGAVLRERLAQNTLLQTLVRLHTLRGQRRQQLDLMRLHALQSNSEHVRTHLHDALRQSGETTYQELLMRLDATLEANPALCSHLAHRYPVLLIDEAQDLNRLQAEVLQRIYGTPQETESGFRLLVGDPKQAIYRFRGSDVHNYTRLKNIIPRHDTLRSNFRSSPALLAELNRYYNADAQNGRFGEDITYQTVTAAITERPIVMRDGSTISAPVQWIAVDEAKAETDIITRLIRHLTSPHSRWLRRDETGFHPLKNKNILVLARSNDYLQTLETALNRAGIACERPADRNIFEQTVAQETAWLLSAMIEPGNSAIVRRLLAGRFYGQSLAALDATETRDTLAAFHGQLARAGECWTQYGLLSALQQLWRNDPFPGTVWTRLAAQPHPDNWRDLLDLRRVQEIIAANEQPPRRFLDWWRRQLTNPPPGEWAAALPLPGSDAVRLMTIHKAKGLQAPVVILAGMGTPQPAGKDPVEPLYDQGRPVLATGRADDTVDAKIRAENDMEARRLLYVALTRAEDLLFIAARKNSPFPPLEQLRHSNNITAQSPDLLLADDTTPAAFAPHPRENTAPPPEPARPVTLHGWRKTSFSALAAHIPAAHRDIAVHDRLDLELAQEDSSSPPADAALPFTFPRGPQAGSFLHEALEKIRWARRAHWPVFFAKLLAKHHLDDYLPHIPELQQWFTDILHTPLPGGAPLHALTKAERELGFSLALNSRRPLPMAAIRAHFAEWGKTLALPDSTQLYRYLRGEIDLLYTHHGRYHVLDYKSNHLGYHARDYHTDAMHRAMDDHHYWLQAALYQTALHRLLQTRLPGYRPETHLGAAGYLFIRAAHPDHPHGRLTIDIPVDWLLHLDKLLS